MHNPLNADSNVSAAALKVGKTQNKVLKLTGEVQALNIQLAQAKAAGKSTSSITSKIAEEQYVPSIRLNEFCCSNQLTYRKKLTTNITADKANAGKASKGVVE